MGKHNLKNLSPKAIFYILGTHLKIPLLENSVSKEIMKNELNVNLTLIYELGF